MTIDFVNIHGARIIPAGSSPSYKAPPKQKAEQSASFHKGWRVVGHAPGAMEAAKLKRERDIEDWRELSPEDRLQRYPVKIAHTGFAPWDEAAWRAKTKKTAVRSKPYELHDAAKTCADLATKAGWLDVDCVELSKGEAPAAVF